MSRARKIERFFSQPFHVAEVFTGSPGKYVSLKETIRGFKMIFDGECDHCRSRRSTWSAASTRRSRRPRRWRAEGRPEANRKRRRPPWPPPSAATSSAPKKRSSTAKRALVVATGEMGELGIAPRHAPLITRLKPGQVRVHPGERRRAVLLRLRRHPRSAAAGRHRAGRHRDPREGPRRGRRARAKEEAERMLAEPHRRARNRASAGRSSRRRSRSCRRSSACASNVKH